MRPRAFLTALLAALRAAPPALAAGVPPGWFVFALPGPDALRAPAGAPPAEASGRIVARDGHFADAIGRRIRFFGTNLTADGCFPEKADAPRVAARRRWRGVTLVRR
ncbi:MAG: capsular biosynthesis protein, partial [bacterium]